MHIFLTGEIQVGKSTLLEKALSLLPDVPLAGFRTVKVADVPGCAGSVYIVPAGDGAPALGPENRVGIRRGAGLGAETFPEVFDRRGVALLEGAEDAALIVMDEIGYMESAAARFSQRVAGLLDGDTPILGVVRFRGETPLLRGIRTHRNVKLTEVTAENRDALAEDLAAEVRRQVYRRSDSAGVIAFRPGPSETEVLMIRSGAGWAFPKGHIERGEDAGRAAVRETLEETGVTVRLLPGFRFTVRSGLPGEKRDVIYYLGEAVHGEPAADGIETGGCAWQSASLAESLLRFSQDAPAFRAAWAAIRAMPE